MRYQSLLPLAGLALIDACSAASIGRRATPSGYNYLGCYQDSPQSRVLTGASYTDTSGMTQESCIAFCSSKGYQEAGVEYGSECYCGYQFASQPVQVSDSECNMACAGDSSEKCGDGNRISVFSNGQSAPTTNPGTDGYTLIGCYSDSVSARSLSVPVNAGGSTGNTVASCVSACSALGYPYAGVEYGSECYCDTAIRNNAGIVDGGCNMACSGKATEYCGGSGSIDIYRDFNAQTATAAPVPAGWSSLGCYTDSTSARTLNSPASVPGGSSNMTVEGCLTTCQSSGFQYAGVEYAQECYCGNSIQNGAGLAADQSSCHSPCTGNTAEVCGGSAVLNLYSFSSSSSSSTTVKTTTTTTTTMTTTTTSSTTTASITTTTIPTSSTSSTTTTTTITTTTTPSPTTTSTTTTTTTTSPIKPSTCAPTSTPSSLYLSNPGFESGLTGWTVASYQGSFSTSATFDGYSYENCQEFNAVPTSSATGNRQLSLTATMTNLKSSYYYNVAVAVGRPTTSVSTHSAPYLAIVAGSRQVGGGYICGWANTGPCPSTGTGFYPSAYQVMTAQFQAQYPTQNLQFVVSWIGSDVVNEAVVIDNVVVAPR